MSLPGVRLAVETVKSKRRKATRFRVDGHRTFERRRGSTTGLSCFFSVPEISRAWFMLVRSRSLVALPNCVRRGGGVVRLVPATLHDTANT